MHKFFALVVATILGLIVNSCFGADLNLIVTNGKTFKVTPNSNPNLPPIIEPYSVQIMYLDGIPTNPTNPIPGNPVPEFQSKIQQMTQNVLVSGGTSTTGAAISSVFILAKNGLNDNSLAPSSALDVVGAGINLVLSKSTDADKWSNWRTSVSQALLALQQEAKLSTKQDFVNIFTLISNGMNAATGFNGNINSPNQIGQGILDNINLQQLMELIRFIMELIKVFSGQQNQAVEGVPMPKETEYQPMPPSKPLKFEGEKQENPM